MAEYQKSLIPEASRRVALRVRLWLWWMRVTCKHPAVNYLGVCIFCGRYFGR